MAISTSQTRAVLQGDFTELACIGMLLLVRHLSKYQKWLISRIADMHAPIVVQLVVTKLAPRTPCYK
jgi:hypothetical protein